MSKRRWPGAIAGLLALLLTGLACGLPDQLQRPTASRSAVQLVSPAPSPPVTPTVPQQALAPSSTPIPRPGATVPPTPSDASAAPHSWDTLRPGLGRRLINLPSAEGSVRETLYVLRIDPALYEFSVGYKPGAPQRLMDWQRELDALIVANGGFFTPEYQAIGLIVDNGRTTGTSLAGYGGMLAVTTAGVGVRSLVQQPYDSSEPLLAAVQSFPMLVLPGGRIGYLQEDGQADRRTVVAQDRQGRILFIVAQTGTLTLHELSRYLADSELDLDVALNLDGGASSGIQLAEPVEGVAPYTLLPIVIAVRPRS